MSRGRTRKLKTLWQSLRINRVALYLLYYSLSQHCYENSKPCFGIEWEEVKSLKRPTPLTHSTECWISTCIYSSLEELTIITQEANAPKVGVEICCLLRQDRITGRRLVRFIGRWRHNTNSWVIKLQLESWECNLCGLVSLLKLAKGTIWGLSYSSLRQWDQGNEQIANFQQPV